MHQVMRMGHKQSGYRPPEQDRRLPALGIAFLLGGAGGSLACARLEWLRETLEQGGQASGTLWGALWPDLALLGVMLLSGFLRSGCMTSLFAVAVKGFALSALSTAEVLRSGGSGYAQALCAQLIPGFLSLAALVLLGRQAMALSAARLRLPAGRGKRVQPDSAFLFTAAICCGLLLLSAALRLWLTPKLWAAVQTFLPGN